jgi:hypothetical protein
MSDQAVTISKVAALKAKAVGFKTTLGRASAADKAKHATTPIAEDFNRMLEQIAEAFPGVAFALPKPVGSSHPIFDGLSDVTYFDLEIMTEQIVAILSEVLT